MTFPVYVWKQAPFLRLIVPLMTGIIMQHYLQAPPWLCWIAGTIATTGMLFFNYRASFFQFRFSWLNGIFINMLVVALGALLCWHKNAVHQPGNIINVCQPGSYVMATIDEPPVEKEKSFKTTAAVQYIINGKTVQQVEGTIILYFKKDAYANSLHYGTRVIFAKSLQRIRGAGNPGSFDYSNYAAMQGIFYQAFLQQDDVIILPGLQENPFKKLLYAISSKVLNIISTNITSPQASGLAEALLIGYKGDLDKSLVTSYSNTGVVHIIAISGMHLGLIYWLLNIICSPLAKRKSLRWARPFLIISGLWLFALLTGGGPSVLRSAVMFSCIVIGNSLSRKAVIYNTLAASAFILLCINPYWLRDVGFQLSYTAVLSLIIFMKPIYNCLFVHNKLLDALWKLNAATLAAQVLTIPLCVYYFHQFPVYFLISNVIAVPLSGVIIFGEIILCAVACMPMLAKATGAILQWLINLMNNFIEHMGHLPLALLQPLQLNIPQVILMYGFIAAIACWLFEKK